MEPVSVLGAVSSLTLIGLAVAISVWMRLGIERSIVWAALRAAVQLLAVGAVFRLIFESAQAPLYSGLWVAGMIVVAAFVTDRRAPGIPGLWRFALLSLAASAGVALAVVFGFGIIEASPVNVVVVAGITIGNTMPATVLAVNRAMAYFTDDPGRVETLLALGFDRRQVSRFVAPLTAKTALIPQIERTKVVGLIALPGAMTGLLLAGVEPVDAVVIQLVVMYLILGAVSLSVAVVTTATVTSAFSAGLRIPDWARPGTA
ncbi:MAG: ABC transporter permease [Acidobacteria bacterium]|nr:ABC transporter permease [Acidobacteriota bacterium]